MYNARIQLYGYLPVYQVLQVVRCRNTTDVRRNRFAVDLAPVNTERSIEKDSLMANNIIKYCKQ